MADNSDKRQPDRQLEDRLSSYRERIAYPHMGDSAAAARARIDATTGSTGTPGTTEPVPPTLWDYDPDEQVASGEIVDFIHETRPSRLRQLLTLAAAALAILITGAALVVIIPNIGGESDTVGVLGPETTGYRFDGTIGGSVIPNEPSSLAADADGNIYAADIATRSVHKFDPSGAHIASWTADDADIGAFSLPWDVVVQDDTLYVLDQYQFAVYLMSLDGEVLETWQLGDTGNPSDLLMGLDVGADGRVYIAHANEGVVAIYDEHGDRISSIVVATDPQTGDDRPVDVAVADDGTMYVTGAGGQSIRVFNSEGALLDTWTDIEIATVRSGGLYGLSIAPSGDIYVNSETGVAQVASDGSVLGNWSIEVPFPAMNVSRPGNVAVAEDGTIWIADPSTHRIIALAEDGSIAQEIFDSRADRFSFPGGLQLDDQDTLHVADSSQKRLVAFSRSGDVIREVDWEIDRVEPPYMSRFGAIAFHGEHMYVLDGRDATVVKMTRDGRIELQWRGELLGDGAWSRPRSIHVDSAGHVYLLDTSVPAIFQYSPEGEYILQWNTQARELEGADLLSMAIHNDLLYIAFAANSESGIWTFDLDGTPIERLVEFELDADGNLNSVADSMAVAGTGDIFTVDSFNRTVRWYSPTGDLMSEWQIESGFEDALTIMSIAVDESGTVYVADGDTRQILVYEPIR